MSQQIQVGQTISNGSEQYLIISKLGQGTSGIVYKVQLRSIENQQQFSQLAMKVQDNIESNEIEIMKILINNQCSNLLNIRKYWKSNGKVLIIMDLATDGNLYQFMEKNRKTLSPSAIQDIFIQLCLGVQQLHRLNIIHRDLKPENILLQLSPLTQQYTFKICDYGLSKKTSNTFTKNIGTIYYMAPELLKDTGGYAQSIDIWALGCIWYSLVNNNEDLFEGQSQPDVLQSLLNSTQPIIDNAIQKLKLNDWEKQLMKSMISIESNKRPNIQSILIQIYKNKQSNKEPQKNQNQQGASVIVNLPNTVNITPQIPQNQQIISNIQPNIQQNQSNTVKPIPQIIQNQQIISNIQPNIQQNQSNTVKPIPQIIQNQQIISNIQPNIQQNQSNTVKPIPQIIQNQQIISNIQPNIQQNQSNIVKPIPYIIQNQQIIPNLQPDQPSIIKINPQITQNQAQQNILNTNQSDNIEKLINQFKKELQSEIKEIKQQVEEYNRNLTADFQGLNILSNNKQSKNTLDEYIKQQIEQILGDKYKLQLIEEIHQLPTINENKVMNSFQKQDKNIIQLNQEVNKIKQFDQQVKQLQEQQNQLTNTIEETRSTLEQQFAKEKKKLFIKIDLLIESDKSLVRQYKKIKKITNQNQNTHKNFKSAIYEDIKQLKQSVGHILKSQEQQQEQTKQSTNSLDSNSLQLIQQNEQILQSENNIKVLQEDMEQLSITFEKQSNYSKQNQDKVTQELKTKLEEIQKSHQSIEKLQKDIQFTNKVVQSTNDFQINFDSKFTQLQQQNEMISKFDLQIVKLQQDIQELGNRVDQTKNDSTQFHNQITFQQQQQDVTIGKLQYELTNTNQIQKINEDNSELRQQIKQVQEFDQQIRNILQDMKSYKNSIEKKIIDQQQDLESNIKQQLDQQIKELPNTIENIIQRNEEIQLLKKQYEQIEVKGLNLTQKCDDNIFQLNGQSTKIKELDEQIQRMQEQQNQFTNLIEITKQNVEQNFTQTIQQIHQKFKQLLESDKSLCKQQEETTIAINKFLNANINLESQKEIQQLKQQFSSIQNTDEQIQKLYQYMQSIPDLIENTKQFFQSRLNSEIEKFHKKFHKDFHKRIERLEQEWSFYQKQRSTNNNNVGITHQKTTFLATNLTSKNF